MRSRSNPRWLAVREKAIELALLGCGLLSVLVTVAIAIVLVYNSALFFFTENGAWMELGNSFGRIGEFFSGFQWSAGFSNPKFGVWPLLTSTLWVALIAGCISIPIGLSTAIYLSDYARPRIRAIAKPALEILAGIPSVVYGFFAVVTVTPFLGGFEIPNWVYDNVPLASIGFPRTIVLIEGLEPFNLLSAGIVVGIMIIPTVASLSEDALRSVPRAMRDGAVALGATKFETSCRVVVPAALSGIAASFILAISRAIGETMAVSLAAGEMFRFTVDPREGGATMTGFIVQVAKGDEPIGTTNFNSLFAVAATLFAITLFMNIIAQWFTRRFRQVYQ